jgi:outer membrane protein TolC
MAEGRDEDQRTTRRQITAATRIAYAQAQIAQHELRLVEQSLQLALSQQRDIARRFRTGAASRLDFIGANREVSNYEVRLANSKAEWKATMEDLATYVGPLNPDIEFDPLEQSVSTVNPKNLSNPDAAHPQLRSQEKQLQGAELQADSQAATRWPTLFLSAKTSLDYPNGPVLERIHQNTVSLGLSFPLFDWGQIGSATEQKRAEALSLRYRREQTQLDLNRDWQKAKARLEGLFEQRKSALQSVQESEEIARLSYQSYRAGQLNLLDVQTMNLKLLESRVQKARIDGQLLVQFALMRSLSGTEEPQ